MAVVANVSGKGVPTAMFMAVSKALLEECIRPEFGLEDNPLGINIDICRNNDDSMFVTYWLEIIDLFSGTVKFRNIGHSAPIVVRAGGE